MRIGGNFGCFRKYSPNNHRERWSYEGHHRLETSVEEIQRLMVADGIEPGERNIEWVTVWLVGLLSRY